MEEVAVQAEVTVEEDTEVSAEEELEGTVAQRVVHPSRDIPNHLNRCSSCVCCLGEGGTGRNACPFCGSNHTPLDAHSMLEGHACCQTNISYTCRHTEEVPLEMAGAAEMEV